MIQFDSAKQAKRFLQGIYWYEKRIEQMLEDVDHMRDQAERITQSFSEAGGTSSPMGSKIERAAVSIIDTQAKVEREAEKLAARKATVIAIIDSMEDEREKLVLELRHIRLMPWEQVQHEMHYEGTQTWRVYQSAVRHFMDAASRTE